MDVEAIYTLKGLALKAKMETGVSLDITRIAAGTGRGGDLSILESLADIRQEITVTGQFQRGTQSTIFAMLSNKGLKAGYDLTQIGVFANDPDEGEILYRVAQMERAFPISAEKDFPNFAIDCTFTDTVSNASTVNVIVDQAGMVTASQLALVQALAQEALDAAREAGAGGNDRRVISSRVRNPNKPDYGIEGAEGGGDTAAALVALPYTGTAEVSVDVEGKEYDVNMSTDGKKAPDGTMIIKKMEE